MTDQAIQGTQTKEEGAAGKYIRWIVVGIGVAVICATFVMAIYRKFGG